MWKTIGRHLGKILFAFTLGMFALAYYFDELAPDAAECKEHGGKKLYGECWVPYRLMGKTSDAF